MRGRSGAGVVVRDRLGGAHRTPSGSSLKFFVMCSGQLWLAGAGVSRPSVSANVVVVAETTELAADVDDRPAVQEGGGT